MLTSTNSQPGPLQSFTCKEGRKAELHVACARAVIGQHHSIGAVSDEVGELIGAGALAH